MRIGMFTDTYFPQVSGVSTSVKLLRDELERRGHTVIIFTTTDPEAKPEEGIVRLPSVPFVSFEDRRIAYGGFDRCLKIAREYELDIIHTHTEFSLGMAGRYVASRMKLPTIHTYHTMYENYTHYILNGHLIRPSHVKIVSKLFCNGAKGIITPSQLTYDKLSEYGVKEEMRVIPTGVTIPPYKPELRQTLREELGLAADDIVLLSLSRLSKEKNLAAVIAGFEQVKEQLPKAQLVVVGDGPEREALEEQAAGTQAKAAIHFVGQINHQDVWRYYQMADLYVNASESESQGLTYLEAFANHLPIIAKRNDYLTEIMSDASFGALFDEEAEFATVVANYLQAKFANEVSEIDEAALYPLSATCFGECVERFYQDIIDKYQQEDHGVFDKIFGSIKQFYKEMMLGE
ncbi:glycosyltransferase family 4 protein [Aerococcaceae bacterium NML191292]|nr:glycosyltransferase family 4 protein [Aerococcaceae bacterium NML210727]MCW6654605.1 glycosyltransferase family 4 protein [Aerococcaceae bacterium NML201296]MCW6659226.1 glycosyltransferase family 4 protein [Aerococcaceae bacterium NML191292]